MLHVLKLFALGISNLMFINAFIPVFVGIIGFRERYRYAI